MTNIQLPTRPVNVTRLPALGSVIKLEAEASDMTQLVAHMGLENISTFSASLKFRHWARDGVQVEGELSAHVETQCPVSLAPVAQNINSQFHAKFVPATSKLAKPRLNEDGEMLLDFESDDIPDIFEGEQLDAWEIAIEYLLLEIDHYARADDAEFVAPNDESPLQDDGDDTKSSPFSVLQHLKK